VTGTARARAARTLKPLNAPVMTMTFFIMGSLLVDEFAGEAEVKVLLRQSRH
jgi:hypothetical protein